MSDPSTLSEFNTHLFLCYILQLTVSFSFLFLGKLCSFSNMSKTLVYSSHTMGGFHAFTSINLCMPKPLRIRTIKPCLLSLTSEFKETIHGHSHFGLKEASRFVVYSSGSDETGLSRSSLKNLEENTSETHRSFKGKRKTPNKEEILSLFRRIQASIAKEESTRAKKIKPKPNEEKPTAESILEILHHSQKQERDSSPVERRNQTRTTIESLPKEEKEEVEATSRPTPNFKLTRPPSNFIKRSPIPTLDHLVNSGNEEMGIPGRSELELEKLNKMKLSELKEIAKWQGRRGYSKLKKKELVELLMS